MIDRADLVDETGYYLLEIGLGEGEVWRFTDAPSTQSITDVDGKTFVYQPGLSTPTVGAAAARHIDASISLEVTDDTDWAALEDRGITLDERPATLRRWFTNQKHDAASVVLEGFVGSVVYEAQQDPLSLTVSRAVRRRALQIPRPNERVNANTWPDTGNYSHSERVRGQRYNTVFGYPGHRAGGQPRPGAPAPFVQVSDTGGHNADKVLIAGHRVEATTVRIFNFENGLYSNAAALTVAHEEDAHGRVCATVDLGAPGITRTRGDSMYVGWASTNGGGLVDPRTNSLMRGLGSIWRYLMEAYTDAKIDGARTDAAAEYLDAFKIDAAIWNPQPVTDWIEANLLPLVPVAILQGPHGLYPSVMRWDADSTMAIASLDTAKGHIRRTSKVRRVGEVQNEFSLHYRKDAASGQHRSTAMLSGDDGFLRHARWKDKGDSDSRIRGNYLCKVSQGRYGVRPAGEMSTDVVWDVATAELVLQWRAARDALPRRVVQYEADLTYEWLPIGAVVALNDSEVSFTNRLAILTDYTTSARSVLLSFVLLDHPLKHVRSTT